MKPKQQQKEHHNAYMRARYAANPEKARAYQREWKNKKYAEDPEYRARVLAKNKIRVTQRSDEYKLVTRLKRYSMTVSNYLALYDAQSGCCGICAEPFNSPYSRSVQIDHDHATGKIRGLLCSDCNTSLGKFGDDLEGIMRAVRYLEGSGH